MINETALRDTLLSLATDNRVSCVMITSLLNEVAALRETVRGLDPTFADVMDQKRTAQEEIGAETAQSVIAGYDLIIQRLKEGYVC